MLADLNFFLILFLAFCLYLTVSVERDSRGKRKSYDMQQESLELWLCGMHLTLLVCPLLGTFDEKSVISGLIVIKEINMI